MEAINNTIPSCIYYDLQGFRGCCLTRFSFIIEEKYGRFVGSYCNDKAGEALYTEWGDTKQEVIDKLYDKINHKTHEQRLL